MAIKKGKKPPAALRPIRQVPGRPRRKTKPPEDKAAEVPAGALPGDAEQAVANVDLSFQDLTGIKEMFITLFRSNPIPTALNRLADWVFLGANDAYLNYFGVGLEEVIGCSAVDFGFAPNQILRDHIREQLKKTGVITDLELSLTTSNGEEHTVIGSMRCVQADGEEWVISSFIDITERVRAEKQVRMLASQLNMAEQHERHRISQILHDELQQRLFAIRMHLSLLKESVAEGNVANIAADFPTVEAMVAEAIELTRSLSIELSPAILEGEGLTEAIVWLAGQMREKFRMVVTVKSEGVTGQLDPGLRILLYQTIHELLFNVVKHATVLEAAINMQQENGMLSISVSDGGIGFDTRLIGAEESALHGLHNIKNRLTLMGCGMTMDSNPGAGTVITLHVPLTGKESQP